MTQKLLHLGLRSGHTGAQKGVGQGEGEADTEPIYPGQPTFLSGPGGVGILHRKPSPSPRGAQPPSVHTDSGEQRTSAAESIAQKKIANTLLPPPPPLLATLYFQRECWTPC